MQVVSLTESPKIIFSETEPLNIIGIRGSVQAMVNLNMIDTVGHGIHSMILAQRGRFFPLPDYTKSLPDKVVLEIIVNLIDNN